MKKKIKKSTPRKLKIMPGNEHAIGIILEDVQSKFDTLIEAYGATDKRLERIEAKLDNHDSRLERIEVKLDATVEMVGEIATKVDEFSTLEQRVTHLERR